MVYFRDFGAYNNAGLTSTLYINVLINIRPRVRYVRNFWKFRAQIPPISDPESISNALSYVQFRWSSSFPLGITKNWSFLVFLYPNLGKSKIWRLCMSLHFPPLPDSDPLICTIWCSRQFITREWFRTLYKFLYDVQTITICFYDCEVTWSLSVMIYMQKYPGNWTMNQRKFKFWEKMG